MLQPLYSKRPFGGGPDMRHIHDVVMERARGRAFGK